MKPPFRDRIGFALLLPSVAVPLTAVILAAWRSTVVEGGFEVGPEVLYLVFAVFLVVATISMLINAVVFVTSAFARAHHALPVKFLATHYAEALTIAVWAALFTVTTLEGLGAVVFPAAIMTLGIVSFTRAVSIASAKIEKGPGAETPSPSPRN